MSDVLEALFLSIPDISHRLAPNTRIYSLLKRIARQEVERLFTETEPRVINFPPFGEVIFPYHSMGHIDSLNLLDLDELIIFSFYFKNRLRYKRVLDLGANLGLHSILLSKCGYQGLCYEPDPIHFEILKKNFELNRVQTMSAFNLAISTQNSEKQFVRVLGNTTGSHIAGSKANPYGQLEYLTVKTVDFRSIIADVDFIKMDIEGHEREVLTTTTAEDWDKMDAIIEVENSENSKILFDHFQKLEVNIFAQKKNWRKLQQAEEMPSGYREGSIFVSRKSNMPW